MIGLYPSQDYLKNCGSCLVNDVIPALAITVMKGFSAYWDLFEDNFVVLSVLSQSHHSIHPTREIHVFIRELPSSKTPAMGQRHDFPHSALCCFSSKHSQQFCKEVRHTEYTTLPIKAVEEDSSVLGVWSTATGASSDVDRVALYRRYFQEADVKSE